MVVLACSYDGHYLLLWTETPSVFLEDAGACGVQTNMPFVCLLPVTPRILRAMSERQAEFTNFRRIRIAMGTWNVNGGKQFRSNLLGTAELADWLLDSPQLSGAAEPQGECGRLRKTKHKLHRALGSPCSIAGDS